jgi:hypothetical protein
MMEPSSSSRSIPAAVVEINNQAALEIENGSYQTAAGMLSSALSTMRDFVLENIDSSQADNEEVVATSSDQSLCFFLSSEVASTPSPLRHRICGTNLEIARGDEHLRFVFREPIRISSKAAISMKSFEILSYAMIYNFALLHHLQASDNSVSSGLQRAVSLYEYAQKLLVSSELNIGLLHTLAIANNLGHAHHYLNHEPTAKLCFQRLLEGIMYATESGDAGKALGRRDLPALDGFFRNVMPLIAEFPAAPAA